MLLNPKVNRSSLKKLYLDVFFQFFLKSFVFIYLIPLICPAHVPLSCLFLNTFLTHLISSPIIYHTATFLPPLYFFSHIFCFLSLLFITILIHFVLFPICIILTCWTFLFPPLTLPYPLPSFLPISLHDLFVHPPLSCFSSLSTLLMLPSCHRNPSSHIPPFHLSSPLLSGFHLSFQIIF